MARKKRVFGKRSPTRSKERMEWMLAGLLIAVAFLVGLRVLYSMIEVWRLS